VPLSLATNIRFGNREKMPSRYRTQLGESHCAREKLLLHQCGSRARKDKQYLLPRAPGSTLDGRFGEGRGAKHHDPAALEPYDSVPAPDLQVLVGFLARYADDLAENALRDGNALGRAR
jgi:hypothetical protein